MVWRANNLLVLILALFLAIGAVPQGDLQLKDDVWQEEAGELNYKLKEEPKPKQQKPPSGAPHFPNFEMPNLSGLIIPLGILLLLVVVFLIVKSVFGRTSVSTTLRGSIDLNSIEEIPEDAQLNEILAFKESEANFREAIRVRYLKILRWLSDNRQIAWEPDKTNSQYSTELLSHPDHDSFLSLTRVYEMVWYGEIPIDSNQYELVGPQFDLLLTKWREGE